MFMDHEMTMTMDLEMSMSMTTTTVTHRARVWEVTEDRFPSGTDPDTSRAREIHLILQSDTAVLNWAECEIV